ncbi:hypothetical protein CRYUN_Cryun24cG0127800 [Craigia yunnanensis]
MYQGEEYKLFWPEQSEFVRMAARFGAKIVPFGVVGEDDVAKVVLDYDDLVKIPWQRTQIEEMTELSMKLRPDATGEWQTNKCIRHGWYQSFQACSTFILGSQSKLKACESY